MSTTADEKIAEELGGSMSLVDHLLELRKRLLISLGAVLGGFLICWGVSEHIFHLLTRPLTHVLGDQGHMIFTAPHEAFMTYLKVAAIAGLLVASPVILWQIWRFVAPGLYLKEKTYFAAVVMVGTFFFVGGALFGKRVRKQQLELVRGGSEPPGPGQNRAGAGIFRYRTDCGTVFGHTGNIFGFTQLLAATKNGRRSLTVSATEQLSPSERKSVFKRLLAADEKAVCAALAR